MPRFLIKGSYSVEGTKGLDAACKKTVMFRPAGAAGAGV